MIPDSLAMKYVAGGMLQDNILTLHVFEPYGQLSMSEKKIVIDCFARQFPDCQIVVRAGEQCELWMVINGELKIIDVWNPNNLSMNEFSDKNRRKQRKIAGSWFYHLGGQISWTSDYSTGMLNGRVGTFLFKNKLDVGLNMNINYSDSKVSAELISSSDIGLDSRWYFHIKKTKLAPYVGGGYSWILAPEKDTEWRLFAGTCWVLGSGSLDFGLQYGKVSELTSSIGYTFRF